jgi:hypothetical protein
MSRGIPESVPGKHNSAAEPCRSNAVAAAVSKSAAISFVEHSHAERSHQGVDNRLIEPGEEAGRTTGKAVCRARLGGLLRYYYRVAA